jgi:DNA (cytosine-5)-methyltransferase 1
VRGEWDKPSTTLCKEFISVAFQGHPNDKRFLNQSECKRVGSFPDAFQFEGEFRRHIIKRIGNSVPPLFMRTIAGHVRDTILTPAATLAP